MRKGVNGLKPRKCNFVEYHCLMIRTDLLTPFLI